MFCHSRFTHSLLNQEKNDNLLLNRIVAIQKKQISRTSPLLVTNLTEKIEKPLPNYARPKSASSISRMKDRGISSPAPLLSSKAPAVNQEGKMENHQQCEILLPISFHSQILEINDNNLSYPVIIQKYIKSRGKIPSVYRLLWKSGGETSGNVEGYIINKKNSPQNEFVQPKIIYRSEEELLRDGLGDELTNPLDHSLKLTKNSIKNDHILSENEAKEGHQNNKDKDDFSFKKNTTKFVSNFLRLNEIKEEEEEEMREKERNLQQYYSSNYHDENDSDVFLTKLLNGGSSEERERVMNNSFSEFVRDIDYIDRPKEEVDR